MNYLVVVDMFFGDRPAGSARVAWDIALLMRDWGHSVTIFCTAETPGAPETSEVDGIRVVRFARPRTHRLDPFKRARVIRAGLDVARRRLASTRWDLVHIHSPVQGTVAARFLGDGPRYVYTVHSPVVLEERAKSAGEGFFGRLRGLAGLELRRMEGSLLRRADRIHTLSNFTREAIDRFYGVGGKVSVIPHWCRAGFHRTRSRADARSILKWPADATVFFSVRRLVTRMGLDIAVKALAPVLRSRPNVYFALAGGGPLAEPLRRLAADLGAADRVWFLGQVDDETLKLCYEAADCFLLPTRALECFGLIAIEAFAYGLPVISSDAAALPEVMRPILPQCIVPAGDVDRLTDAVEGFLDGRMELPSSDALVAHVSERYGADVIAPRFYEFLGA